MPMIPNEGPCENDDYFYARVAEICQLLKETKQIAVVYHVDDRKPISISLRPRPVRKSRLTGEPR